MTKFPLETLSRDLHAFADEATDHLRDAATKTGSDAAESLARSTKAISRAADRLRDEAGVSAGRAHEAASGLVRDHPIAADLSTSMITSLGVAVLATLALVRLAQS